MEAITTALTSAVTTIGTDAMDAVAKVLPAALPIFGAIVVVGIGLKVFKKVTGR